ncbi:trifunctional serine/threonine-protein kinase/ATP-binding protein/sensor histidine kinase [Nostoc sp. FACHB-280]|uniref:ATP-binding sensor histidine kinase n=1 Tax=Nostoc sp. FACHB-280 TaxID=2692839 RepID=UPI00168AD10F|nr:trifunctional serine/threonine-protein kinase/ATP-binding protein/sensor histidine kinase [Nostoc sp. FACHB-280]MBD2494524.1 AAA family ATPase [Nostoc sp. FACHB-280]
MATFKAPIIPGYKIGLQLYAGSRTIVYRAIRELDQLPVVIKLLTSEYPTFQELLKLRNQYTISKNLNITGIIQPLSLETYNNGYILVMADTGEISLRDYIQSNTLSLTEFLRIGIQLSVSLYELHQNRVIHKDIKPANILIHPQTKQVQLIDFSIASLLPKETSEIKNPNILEGTLAYISPEQTGRMNRGIDYRSDYYSLGVTFYELLTGELPFNSDDPMELVHCHLAKMPTGIEYRAEIPLVLTEIVLKLMAKNAEDRYQSALGLKYDLELCLTQLQDTGKIRYFKIGERDVYDRFLIPEKLYGREAEVSTLLQAFERVASGTSEMMLVAGFSGIGKTAVINEIHKPITRQKGYFIKGKFDQFNRNIPFSAFVQALRDLMGQLLSESDAKLVKWQSRILEIVGENGQVLVEVIPELERLIGKQPPAPELSVTEAQNRFNVLFQKFIAIFTTSEHPLVMFLDDLQWADLASLQLIKLLMEDENYLLLLGAYRDNEVSPAHPLMLMVEELKKAGKTVNTITLNPLAAQNVNRLIADTLRCPTEQSQPLTELIERKTRGNPFFITQFLKKLYEDGEITFNHQEGYWECDIIQIQALSLTDDVVEFVAQQLQKLPQETQNILQLAACIGNSFDLRTLAIVSQQSVTNVATALWKALQEGLILPTSQTYKLFQTENEAQTDSQKSIDDNSVNLTYRFLHDRIQQAAYKLIAADQRQSTHLAIGKLLYANTPETQLDKHIFEIINHLNKGIDLITQPDEKLKLAQLNFMAGCKAKSAIAYNAAINYFNLGIDLLPADTWITNYELTLNLHHQRLEAACLSTDFDKLAVWGDIILQSATSLLDTIKVHETRMIALRSQSKFAEVVETALQVLKLLGVEFPEQPTMADISAAAEYTRQLWQERTPLSLLDLPVMNDPYQLAAMQIMTKLVSSVYAAKPALLPLITFKQVQMSIQFGNSSIAIFSYADYGLILCGLMEDIHAGYEFGQLSLKLLEQYQITAFKSRAYFITNSFIHHWKEPLQNIMPSLLAGYQIGLETGDWECVALNLLVYANYCYWSGRELTELAEEMQLYRQVISQIKQEAQLKYYECCQQTILNLLGNGEVPYFLQGTVFDVSQVLPSLQVLSDRLGLFYVYMYQAFLCYLFGKDELALQQTALAEQYSDASSGSLTIVVWFFYDALIHLMQYETADTEQQSRIIEQVNSHQEKLQNWANLAPFNHQHRWQLVAAEKLRVLGQNYDAMAHYDLAIAAAKTHGYLQEEALSNELAAKFYLNWGKEKVAAGYMQEAYYCYARWGSQAKTQDLENCYPQLLQPILQQKVQSLNVLETLSTQVNPQISIHSSKEQTRSSSSNINVALDFGAILKASQAISGTIQLDELLQKLTQIILQHSGGDRCALILPDSQGEWQVRAIATLDNTELFCEPLENNPNLPVKFIQYVKNTQEIVVVNELQTDLPVIDEYLLQRQPKSLLCLPILNQGNLIGILYLKNRSTSNVFTSDRVLILNFLCTQAAISLENARLYEDSQIYAHQLEESLEKLRLSENRFQKLADNIPGLIYQIRIQADGSSSISYVSSGCQTLYEVTAEDLMSGKYSLRDFEHPDDQAELFRATMESGQNLTTFRHEWRIITPNGNVKWVKAVSRPEISEDGEMVWDGIVIDISDRKRAEQEQQQLLAIVNATPDIVGITDANGNNIYINPAGQRVWQLKDSNAKLHISSLTPPQAMQYMQSVAVPTAIRQGTWSGESAILDINGKEIPVSQVVIAHKNAADEVEYLSTIIRDISDRKQAEAAIEQKSLELQQALNELKQTQLQMVQQEKMSALGNLVAGVAHEMNNPLGFISASLEQTKPMFTDITTHLQLYQKALPNPEDEILTHATEIDLEYSLEDLPKILDAMVVACGRLKSISTSLRTFSRADQNYKVLFNINEGIDSTILILKHRLKANEKRPEIIVVTDYDNLQPIPCFPGQLNQVFMNIIANAIDALDESSIGRTFEEIKINPYKIIVKTAIENNHVQISIADNGQGMSEDIKSQIFDYLFTTKEVGKGTGLGLAIARQIVEEKHGGKIAVNSVLGEGTEFIISLPITDDTINNN